MSSNPCIASSGKKSPISQRPMKHLIVGMGSIGKRHARYLSNRGHEVMGVDPLVSEGGGVSMVASMDEAWMMKPDMVWVCSPTNLHAEQVLWALEKGLPVFVEKPVASSLESALRIRETWKRLSKKRLVWVGCNMRFHPGALRLKKALEEGLVGRPLVFRIHFSHYLPNMRPGTDYRQTYAAKASLGGGIIRDDIHDIDLALWYAGPVARTVALAARSGALDMDAEDVAHISLLHQNGAFSEIHMDFLRRDKSRGVEVIGEKGTLEWRSTGKNPEAAVLRWAPAGEREPREIWRSELGNADEMFEKQLTEVLEALSCPSGYESRLDDGIEALRIAEEARTGCDCPR
jgi:predicted dehydrogenase